MIARYAAKVRITDPDVIDRVKIELRTIPNGNVIKEWHLGNYQSTGVVSLSDGKCFLAIKPYIDPLPVWFKIYNTGNMKLLAKCVLSELQTEGSKQFKDIAIIKPNRWLYVPATIILEYRVERFRLGRLDVLKVEGVKTDHLRYLNEASIINVEDLTKTSVSKLTHIFGARLADIIRKRAINLNTASVSSSKHEILGNYYVKSVAGWSVDKICRVTSASSGEAEILKRTLAGVVEAVKEHVLDTPLYIGDLFEGG